VAADENAVDGLAFRSEILNIGVAWNGASHGLSVGDDHGRSLNDGARPTEFLRAAEFNSAGIEHDAAGLNLLDGHAAVLRFFAVFVGQLDEVDEVCVEERDSAASRVCDFCRRG
jgi:hypothetical protein